MRSDVLLPRQRHTLDETLTARALAHGFTDLPRDSNALIDGITIKGTSVTIRGPVGPPQATASLWRVSSLLRCYSGPDHAFGSELLKLVRRFLARRSLFPPTWSFAMPHPELSSALVNIFGLDAIICSPLCIPWTLKPVTPIFLDGTAFSERSTWAGAAFNRLTEDSATVLPWSHQGIPVSTLLCIHRQGHCIIPFANAKHTATVLSTMKPCILIKEGST